MSEVPRVAFPGSFDPPTIAHLSVARAAHEHLGGARVDWVVSRVALGKEAPIRPTFAERIAVLRVAVDPHPWLAVAVTDACLIADIAEGYDAVVVGADKWRQILDPCWYVDAQECARMVARLPRVLVVPRAGDDLADLRGDGHGWLPGDRIEVLSIAAELRDVSSTAARSGARELMLPEVIEHADRTGQWRPNELHS